MNETGRPPERPAANNITARDRSGSGGQRAWRRTVNHLSDDDLIRVVRGMSQVDRAVENCRRARAA